MNIDIGAEIKDQLEDEINAWRVMAGALEDMDLDDAARDWNEYVAQLRERYRYMEENYEQ